MEMADIPILDKGGYVMLGSDDYLPRLMTAKKTRKPLMIMSRDDAIG
jgi:formylmethanofuran dehydrogenase subunit A